jgi:hypothetical protein
MVTRRAARLLSSKIWMYITLGGKDQVVPDLGMSDAKRP